MDCVYDGVKSGWVGCGLGVGWVLRVVWSSFTESFRLFVVVLWSGVFRGSVIGTG